ncbi:acyl transferase/acyl hydrolase/lysophospholipase [Armillaria fumosa]|nr:acyl transferase/acyl hydrolase/lysophospholipase [Armillaria fumosa]
MLCDALRPPLCSVLASGLREMVVCLTPGMRVMEFFRSSRQVRVDRTNVSNLTMNSVFWVGKISEHPEDGTRLCNPGGMDLMRDAAQIKMLSIRRESKQANSDDNLFLAFGTFWTWNRHNGGAGHRDLLVNKPTMSRHQREIRTGVKGTTALMVVSSVKSHLLMASDTLNNCPVNLLSLDGGGIRGVSQLIILDEIMKCIQVKKHLTEVPKPCEYFHLIGGSGTGGLNAIMLGHLKMSTEDALHNYKKLVTAVFSPDNRKPFYKDGKFKASTLEVEIKEIVKNSCVGYTGDELLLDPDAGKGSIGNISIMVVGLGGISSSYIDAGLGHNNPSKEVRDEAMQLFGNDCPAGVFFSIGTGHPGSNGFQQPRGMEKILSLKLMKTVTKIAADCETVSFDFAKQYNSSPGTYFRFNVIHGTGILAVDDWQREADILAHTNAYLRDPNISAKIEEHLYHLYSLDVKDIFQNLKNISQNVKNSGKDDHFYSMEWEELVKVKLL